MKTLQTFKRVDDIMAVNDYTKRWSSANTMKFFGGRLYGSVHYGRYFISSEVRPYDGRRYTIRVLDADDRIQTVGEMGEYGRYTAASKALDRKIAAGELTKYADGIEDARI